MPTGYTAPVLDGTITELRDFAYLCAHNFDALISEREKPLTPTLPEHVPVNDYYFNTLTRDEKELDRLTCMSEQEAELEALKSYEDELVRRREMQAKRDADRARYEAMLEKARAWNPPTDQHFELRRFMIEQLTKAIDFDCGSLYTSPVKKYTGAEWLQLRTDSARRMVERSRESWRKQTEGADRTNAWIKALRESFE